MRQRICTVSLLSSLAILLCGPAARAAPIQDASFEGPTNGIAINGALYRAQTFTARTSGLLTGFEVLMSSDGYGDIIYEIWSTVGGAPQAIPGTALAVSFVAFDSGTAWVASEDLSSFDLHVTAGDVLALVQIGGTSSGAGSWLFAQSNFLAPGDRYTDGAGYTTNIAAPAGVWHFLNAPLGNDYAFRTFVEPDVVPIPAACWLLGSALGTLSWIRRKAIA